MRKLTAQSRMIRTALDKQNEHVDIDGTFEKHEGSSDRIITERLSRILNNFTDEMIGDCIIDFWILDA